MHYIQVFFNVNIFLIISKNIVARSNELIEYLIENDAHLEQKDKNGYSPLMNGKIYKDNNSDSNGVANVKICIFGDKKQSIFDFNKANVIQINWKLFSHNRK